MKSQLVARLNKLGMAPSPLSICGVGRPYAPGLVIGFTNIDTKNVQTAVQRLAAAVGST